MNKSCQNLAQLLIFHFTTESPLSIPQLIEVVINFEKLAVCFQVVGLLKADSFNTVCIAALYPPVIPIAGVWKACVSLRGNWSHSLKSRLLGVMNTQKLQLTQEFSETKTIGNWESTQQKHHSRLPILLFLDF